MFDHPDRNRRLALALTASVLGHGVAVYLGTLGFSVPPVPLARASPPLQYAALISETPLPPPVVLEPVQPEPALANPATAEAATVAQAASAPAEPARKERYFRTAEVDRPAFPLQEWSIDTSGLPAGESIRAVLAVWVSPTGRIDRIEISELTPDSGPAREALSRLAETPMSPAVLQEQRVANVRYVEVIFSRER